MNGTLGLLETVGLTPAMVAIDAMTKAAAVRIAQLELNDLYGVCLKVVGATADVQTAIEVGRRVAEAMHGRPIARVITRTASTALPALESALEYNPLIQQHVVFPGDAEVASSPGPGQPPLTATMNSPSPSLPAALGFIETQGFTAVFEAIDTACKAADVTVVGKEKLGGGYVTVVVQGELSAVTAAIDAARPKAEELGKLIAAHVIARPSPAVLHLLPRL
jgi:microcompartment protein CcmL/EutN